MASDIAKTTDDNDVLSVRVLEVFACIIDPRRLSVEGGDRA
jgi:hypothetical protein